MPKLVHSSQFTVHSKGNSVNRERKTLNRRFWRPGFTLHELLITAVIIAILATIGFIGGGSVLSRIRDSRRITDVNAIKLSVEAYYEKNHLYPSDGTRSFYFSSDPQPWIPGVVEGGYTKALPKDPKQTASILVGLAERLIDKLKIKSALAVHELQPPDGQGMLVRFGKYTGDGSTDRQITGLGFQPDFVFVKGDFAGSSEGRGIMRTSTSTGTASKSVVTGTWYPDTIKSLDADGFTVGDESYHYANASGYTYYYLALGASGSGKIKALSYPGDGTLPRTIDSCGFRPDMVLLLPDDFHPVLWRTSTMLPDQNQGFETALGPGIESFTDYGFKLTAEVDYLNAVGVTYHALCAQKTPNVFNVLSYPAGGADNRPITGAGFRPDGALVKSGNTPVGIIRFKDQVGDSSFSVRAGPSAPDFIQRFLPDGFEVGLTQQVNTKGGGYHAAVWNQTFLSDPQFVYLYYVSADRKSYDVWATLENKKDPGIYDHATAQCQNEPPIEGYNYCGAGF